MAQPAPFHPDELRDTFYWAGITLHSAQMLEYGMKLLTWLLARLELAPFTLEETDALIEGRAKATAGQLLARLRTHVQFDEGSETALRKGLDSRNTFVHGYLNSQVKHLLDPAARDAVIAEIKDFRRDILAADTVIRNVVNLLLPHMNVDPAEVEKELRAQVEATMQARLLH